MIFSSLNRDFFVFEFSLGGKLYFRLVLIVRGLQKVIADPVIADAIRDRLEHASLTINITGKSYRGVKARKLATKKHSA
jgi:hypothetical protein